MAAGGAAGRNSGTERPTVKRSAQAHPLQSDPHVYYGFPPGVSSERGDAERGDRGPPNAPAGGEQATSRGPTSTNAKHATEGGPRAPAVRIAVIVALAHGLNDAYASIVHPLLPRIMETLDLSIAAAATLAAAFSIATALPQPLFGYVADRFGRRSLAVGGMLASAVFVSSIGFAPSYAPLLGLLVLGGLGGAAFHPPGASYAVRLAAGRGGGARYSIFSFGGATGYAAGPLAAVALVSWRGLEGLWFAMIPALLLAPVFYLGLPGRRSERRDARPLPPPRTVLRKLLGPLGIIFGISSAMTFVQRVFLTMEPIVVAQAGGSEALGAAALSVYLGAQALGTLAGGFLSDRMDRPRLLFRLCACALPAHLLALWLGPWSGAGMAAIAAAGFLGMATLPPIVVMAQEMLPQAPGASSGIVMGLAWTVGAVLVMGAGVLADFVGPLEAAAWSTPAAGLAALLALHPALKWMKTDPAR